MSNKIAWMEGMLLKPHHFQQQDKYNQYTINKRIDILHENHWGLISLELDHSELQYGNFKLLHCEGITRCGTLFNAPNKDKLPDSLKISSNNDCHNVYLVIPSNTNDTKRYTIKEHFEQNIYDTSSDASMVYISQINLMLTCDEKIAIKNPHIIIAEIKEVKHNNTVILNYNYIPPVLNAVQHSFFIDFIYQIKEITNNITKDNTQSATAESYISQATIHYSFIFDYYLSKKTLHPEALFYLLVNFYGKLYSITNTKRHHTQPIQYNHNNIRACFNDIKSKIFNILSQLQNHIVIIKLKDLGNGMLKSTLLSEDILVKYNIYFSINQLILKKKQNISLLLKIASSLDIDELVQYSLPGMSFKSENIKINTLLNSSNNYKLYKLNKNSESWRLILKCKEIAIQILQSIDDIDLKLWAIKSNNNE